MNLTALKSAVKRKAITTVKSQETLVKELHDEFDTAADRILESANSILSKAASDRAERLRKLGFGSNREVREDNSLQLEKESSSLLAGLVERYKTRYPDYKFITHEEAIRIANKYGLVLGKAADFIGHIPEENLLAIENANVSQEDFAYISNYDSWNGEIVYAPLGKSISARDNLRIEKNTIDISVEASLAQLEALSRSLMPRHLWSNPFSRDARLTQDSNLKVVAPLKDFNTVGKIVKSNELIKDDPIVLRPVIGGYLILTAWGPEASEVK